MDILLPTAIKPDIRNVKQVVKIACKLLKILTAKLMLLNEVAHNMQCNDVH